MKDEPARPSGVGESKRVHHHHLPHWQIGGSTYFITFRSERGPLPECALEVVRAQVLQGHGLAYDLAFGVVMPDHVHLLIRPIEIEPGLWHNLSVILKQIKGTSARKINLTLGTSGTVWQKES